MRKSGEVSQPLHPLSSVEDILYQLLPTATQLVHAEASSVWLWGDEQKRFLRCESVYSCGDFLPNKNLILPAEDGFIGWIATNNQSALSPDFSKKTPPDYATRAYPNLDVSSVIGVPLQAHGRIMGVLEV